MVVWKARWLCAERVALLIVSCIIVYRYDHVTRQENERRMFPMHQNALVEALLLWNEVRRGCGLELGKFGGDVAIVITLLQGP